MAQVYAVTASTSVVLVSTLGTPYTVVYLSSISNPGHIVGIRDATGSPLLGVQPIIVSTVEGIHFYDGTFSTLITQPYGSLTVASKTPTTWQLLNSVGFFTTLSNAYLSSLTATTGYVTTLSSVQEFVSSAIAGNVIVTRSIELGGTAQIQGDITVAGPVSFFSTMDVYGLLAISSACSVGGNFRAQSTVTVQGEVQILGALSTPQTLSVRDSLFVGASTTAFAALLPRFLSVTTFEASLVSSIGGLQAGYDVSTQSTLYIGNALRVAQSTLIQGPLTVSGTATVSTQLTTASNLRTRFLSTLGLATVQGSASFVNALTVSGTVSTLETASIGQQTQVDGTTVVGDSVLVGETSLIRDLTVLGLANLSSIHILSTVQIQGDVLSYGGLFRTLSDLQLRSSLGIGGPLLAQTASGRVVGSVSTLNDLGVGTTLSVGDELLGGASTVIGQALTNVSTLRVEGTLSTGSLYLEGELTVLGFLSIGTTLGASTLGAPIDYRISTLTLSNSLVVSTEAKVPVLDIPTYPTQITVGSPPSETLADLRVEGVLLTHSSIVQPIGEQGTKQWTLSSVQTSTVWIQSLLSTTVFGASTIRSPSVQSYGAILTGSFPGSPNLYSSSNISSLYSPAASRFLGAQGGSKIAYGGSRWVAVGSPPSPATPSESILTSGSGYTWTTASLGGFAIQGNDVQYGNDMWIAVGCNLPGRSTIQMSYDGSSWYGDPTGFDATAGGYGSGIAYNGSNQWIAVGSNPGYFGVKYSYTGLNWSNATLIPPLPFVGAGVGYGDGRWVASDGLTNLVTSTDGLNWLLLSQPLGKTSFAHNGLFWVAGGPATGANPLTSIHLSPDGTTWIPIASGGYTQACTDVTWDAQTNLWLATGRTNPPTSNVLQYSQDGFNWTSMPMLTGAGAGNGIAVGSISAPDTDPYFTLSMTTRFQTGLSSLRLTTDRVEVSSLTSPAFFGDGIGISNVTSFRDSVNTSSFKAQRAYALDLSAQRFQQDYALVAKDVLIDKNPFLSSVTIWLATGADSEATGNIQTSVTGFSWIRGLAPTFDYYGKAITGNCNAISPVYVATGADSRSLYTLQWSEDARTWSPISNGGFYVTQDGVNQGNSVTYNTLTGLWVAAGNNQGTVSTLYYSSDARNWTPGSNAFLDSASFVAAGPTGYLALGGPGVKYSGDGIFWSNSATSVILDTVAYGKVGFGPLFLDGWLGSSNTTLYGSENGGTTWSLIGTSIEPIKSLVYGGGVWVGVGCNYIQYSSNGASWAGITTIFAPDTIFNAVAYSETQGRWVAAALSTTADKSLWSSSNLLNWAPSQSGGFSTSIISEGAGYGVYTSSLFTFAVGKASFNGITSPLQAILSISSTGAGSYVTSNSLTELNANNVFESEVRGVGGNPTQPYHYVAVGDGDVPQKTIARSQTGGANTWIPAIVGGFSTTGYAVTDYNGLWLAVGDAQASTNTIQYSLDGASWFGTNTAQAVRLGGRGIGAGLGTLATTLVAVGKDSGQSTIAYSKTGYAWTGALGSFFTVEGRAVAGGSNAGTPNFVAVGLDSRGSMSTILRSANGTEWSNILIGGFTSGGYGISYGLNTYVAVGMDANSNKTIQYSTDGGDTFYQANAGSFTKAGYGVAFNPDSNLFLAVGEDVGAVRSATVKYSGDGQNWSNISSFAGFQSQITLGAGYGVFTQLIQITEVSPYIEFSNLFIYERSEPLLYPVPTIRLQSSFMTFMESMTLTLSSQMVVRSNVPLSTPAVLSVYGDIYASSFFYTGSIPLSERLNTLSLVVSTLSSIQTLEVQSLLTPSLGLNTPVPTGITVSTLTATVSSFPTNTGRIVNVLGVNDTLYVTSGLPYAQQTGINISSPMYDLEVGGSFGVSSLSTSYLFAPSFVQATTRSGTVIRDSYFTLATGSNAATVSGSNTLLATPSTLTLNSVVTTNLSTQKVGVYTRNPQFSLDVRAHGILNALSSPSVRTSLLFLTLQSA
jgi:hypothetical protein